MSDGNFDKISANEKAANAFIEALANGNSSAAAQCLRQLNVLDGSELSIMADLLDGKAHPSLFPWRLVVRARRPGRTAKRNKQYGGIKPSNSDNFFNALGDRNTSVAADFLRLADSLSLAELGMLADLLDDNPKADFTLPWKLQLQKLRPGKPVDSLRTSAEYFVLNASVAGFATHGTEAAIKEVETRAHRSRAAIQRARRHSRPKQYK
jgi:hypothetical protein